MKDESTSLNTIPENFIAPTPVSQPIICGTPVSLIKLSATVTVLELITFIANVSSAVFLTTLILLSETYAFVEALIVIGFPVFSRLSNSMFETSIYSPFNVIVVL